MLKALPRRTRDELGPLAVEMAGRPGFDPAEPAARAMMHERDRWSARLLELTATLDALAARRAAARAAHDDDALPEELQALRATVEALEEVQRA